jgi:hypothetical protein
MGFRRTFSIRRLYLGFAVERWHFPKDAWGQRTGKILQALEKNSPGDESRFSTTQQIEPYPSHQRLHTSFIGEPVRQRITVIINKL